MKNLCDMFFNKLKLITSKMSPKMAAIFAVFVLLSAIVTYSMDDAYAKTYTQSTKPSSNQDKKAVVEKAKAEAQAALEKELKKLEKGTKTKTDEKKQTALEKAKAEKQAALDKALADAKAALSKKTAIKEDSDKAKKAREDAKIANEKARAAEKAAKEKKKNSITN